MRTKIYYITLFFFVIGVLAACKKEIDPDKNQPIQKVDPEEEPKVENKVGTSGGTIEDPDGIKVVFPNGALAAETEVKINNSNAGDADITNSNFKLKGNSFSVSFDADALTQDIKITALVPSDVSDPAKSSVMVAANPVLPVNFTVSGQNYEITLDKLAFNYLKDEGGNNGSKTKTFLFVTSEPQSINQEELGVKEIDLSTRGSSFVLNNSAPLTEDDRVLLLIHGWAGTPSSTWTDFYKEIYSDIEKAKYTKMLSFGYYSGESIDKNGKALADYLKNNQNDAPVDIIAHNMGGLVARSAIENHSAKVRDLITIGTPHQGVDEEVMRFYVSLLAKDNKNPAINDAFRIGSDGWKDMVKRSVFLNKLAQNKIPDGTTYTPIAVVTDNTGDISGITELTHLKFEDGDGLVEKSSALAIPGNEDHELGETIEVAYNFDIEGTQLPSNKILKNEKAIDIVGEVIENTNMGNNSLSAKDFLNPDLSYGSVTDIDGNEYATIQIGDQVWMAENLRVSRFNDGEEIKNISGPDDISNYADLSFNQHVAFSISYQYDQRYDKLYGKYYNGYIIDGDRICPAGWHLPNWEDRDQFGKYVNGEHINDYEDLKNAAKRIMAKTNMWQYNEEFISNEITNEYGFSALPTAEVTIQNQKTVFYIDWLKERNYSPRMSSWENNITDGSIICPTCISTGVTISISSEYGFATWAGGNTQRHSTLNTIRCIKD